MKFEEALKAMREGKEVRLGKSTGSYFMQTHTTSKGNTDVRIYYKSADGKKMRVTNIKVKFLTMLEWSIIEDE